MCFRFFMTKIFQSFQMVYPKSDEQRQRLAESVRNILLFRALDKVQMAKYVIFLASNKCNFSEGVENETFQTRMFLKHFFVNLIF